jgi:SAM-dependent methyltransferase
MSGNPSDRLVKVLPLPIEPTWFERLVFRRKRFGPIRCPVCGRWSYAWGFDPANERETGWCRRCHATNRHRQLARIAAVAASELGGDRFASLAAVGKRSALRIFNTEASGPVHEMLSSARGYVASEYLGADVGGGEVRAHVRHEDLQALSFPDGSFDLVLSSDVFEHVPDPYRAHAEVARVLVEGGRHVFTVPFQLTEYRDEVRAEPGADGSPRLLAEPIYHVDPIRLDEGALVYTVFSIEMLTRLAGLGLWTRMYRVHEPRLGIFGRNAIVFESIKRR